MKITIEKSLPKANQIIYKGITIRENWNGFDFKEFVLGYKLNTLEEAKNYIDLVKSRIEESTKTVDLTWPENR